MSKPYSASALPRAVGRKDNNDIVKTSPDPRFPATLAVIAQSAASYADVHLYSAPGEVDADLASADFSVYSDERTGETRRTGRERAAQDTLGG